MLELLALGALAFLLLGVKMATAPALFERAERLEAQNAVQIADSCPDGGEYDKDSCYSSPVQALAVLSGEAERKSGHEGQNVFWSPIPVLVGFLGLCWAAWLAPRWGLIGLIFWCLGWGGVTPVNLLSALHNLPGFDHLRVVERYSLVWTLFLGWGAGFLVDRLWERWKWGWAAIAVVLAGLWLPQAHQHAKGVMNLGPQRGRPSALADQAFRQLKGPHSNFEAIQAGQGKLDCWTTAWLEDPADALRAVGEAGYQGEAWMAETGETVSLTVTTSSLEVVLPYSGEVVINQNAFRGWSVGDVALSEGPGLLRANLEGGVHRFRYRPPGLLFGFGLSGLGAVLLAGFWRQRGFYRRASERVPPP